MKPLYVAMMLVIFSMTMTSCSSWDPEKNKLKVSSQWLTTVPKARPVSEDKKLVYLSVRNTSGIDADLNTDIRKYVQDLGYKITGDLDKAQFVLQINLRYYGEKSKTGYVNTVGGAIIGAAAGNAIGGKIGSGKSSNRGAGMAIGAVLGALIGRWFDNRNKYHSKDMVVDIRLGEKVAGGIKTDVKSNNKSGLNQSNRKDKEGGFSDSGTSESSKFTRNEKFFYHDARLLSTAKKNKLTNEEAKPKLIDRICRSASQILP